MHGVREAYTSPNRKAQRR